MWFKRKQKLLPGNEAVGESTFSEAPPKRDKSIEAVLKSAEEILYRDGPAKTLEYLRDSPYVQSEPVVRKMHALVWTHYQTLPEELLAEAFLDPIWCQCTVCEHTWLITPLSLIGQYGPATGLRCSSCGRVLCPDCATVANAHCPCGGSLVSMRQPNGRRRHEPPAAEAMQWDWPYPPTDIPGINFKDLHLYFGWEGWVPIGVDCLFPLQQTAAASDHLRWAEMLVDAGIYYQAHQQLDILKGSDASSARAQWLRARLELVSLHNARERSRRHLGGAELEDRLQKIKQWLDDATRQMPEFGPACLTMAQVCLDPSCGQDFARALQCAEQARALLGSSPTVLLLLGQALRGVGRPSEALAILSQIPGDSAESEKASREIELANLEVRCQSEPVDVEAHLLLGRWCLRHDQQERAQEIFTRLVDRCPGRAKGYYGLAQLTFSGYVEKLTPSERLTRVHQLCHQALALNPHFGLAYELLGSVFRNLRLGSGQVTFPPEDPLSYYKQALEYDATCDVALWALAEDCIDLGQLQPALEYLEKAADLDTDNSSVYYLLAAIYRGKRQLEQEDRAMRRAKELSPGTSLSAEYQNKILNLCGFEY